MRVGPLRLVAAVEAVHLVPPAPLENDLPHPYRNLPKILHLLPGNPPLRLKPLPTVKLIGAHQNQIVILLIIIMMIKKERIRRKREKETEPETEKTEKQKTESLIIK
jgi:hypothetical protein